LTLLDLAVLLALRLVFGVLLLCFSMWFVSWMMQESAPDAAMLRRAIPRLAILLLVVNLVGLTPHLGLVVNLVIWIPGLILALNIPFRAAFALALANWFVNLIVGTLIFYVVSSS